MFTVYRKCLCTVGYNMLNITCYKAIKTEFNQLIQKTIQSKLHRSKHYGVKSFFIILYMNNILSIKITFMNYIYY